MCLSESLVAIILGTHMVVCRNLPPWFMRAMCRVMTRKFVEQIYPWIVNVHLMDVQMVYLLSRMDEFMITAVLHTLDKGLKRNLPQGEVVLGL